MRQGTSIHQSIIHLLPHIQPPSVYPRKRIEIPRPAERYNLAHCYEPFSPCTTAVKCCSELLSPILLTVWTEFLGIAMQWEGLHLWPQDFISTFCG